MEVIGNAPVASAPCRAGRRPSRSAAIAVATTSTLLSASSTQSTGISAIRNPALGKHQELGVDNQPVSPTSGSSRRATSARIALNSYCTTSENRVRSVPRSSRS